MTTSKWYLADTSCVFSAQGLELVERDLRDGDILLRIVDTLDQSPEGICAIRVCKPRWRCSCSFEGATIKGAGIEKGWIRFVRRNKLRIQYSILFGCMIIDGSTRKYGLEYGRGWITIDATSVGFEGETAWVCGGTSWSFQICKGVGRRVVDKGTRRGFLDVVKDIRRKIWRWLERSKRIEVEIEVVDRVEKNRKVWAYF